MRLVILSLALALTASAPLAAETQAPVSVQPLAQSEVLLEINALGIVTSRADRATMTFNISGSGETEAEARNATAANIREVRASLRRLGIAEADITIGSISTSMSATTVDMSMDAASNAMEAMENVADASMTTMTSASGQAQADIVIRNVDRVPAVQQALNERGIFMAVPVYALTDDAGPRRQARAQALQKARADAEAYAAPLNMRIVRVVRVSERLGLDLFGLFASEMQLLGQMFTPAMMRGGPEVHTIVTVGVDYALAPR